jgi:CDP-diacylglycerol---serine O-phosphatidyltransferase
MARQFTVANLVTSASLVLGLAALLEATRTGVPMFQVRLWLVFGLIATAAVLDAIDGPLARRFRTAGRFGSELDSLTDIVAFGVAPAFAVYFSELHRVYVLGVVICGGFCLCAAWRLARFSLCSRPGSFVGCPVPLAAVILALLTALEPGLVVTLVATAILGGLMVATVPFPTWCGVHALTRVVNDHIRPRGSRDQPPELIAPVIVSPTRRVDGR